MVYVCKFCDLDYNVQRDWKRHILKVHGIESYGCDTCPETFYEEKDLLEHVEATHNGQQRHQCTLCSMSYKRGKDLSVHIHYRHKIDEMIACEKCGQEFHNNIAYKKHLQMHHKPGHVYHKCKHCQRSFRFKHQLQLHEEFDHGKNGKKLLLKYIKKLNLEKGVLPDVSQCSLCKIKFNCSFDLIQHLKQNHSKKKSYACCQCKQAVYYSRASLGIHMRHEHGILSHSCSKCPAPQRPSKTAPIKPKRAKVKKHVLESEPRSIINKSVLRQLTNKPSQKNKTPSIAKSKAPWATKFINENLPSDLELKNVSEQQLKNLSHNIKTVFNILSTVAPSRLKASQTAALSKKPRIIGRNMNIVSFMFPQNHPGSRTPTMVSKKSDNLMEVVIQQVETKPVISNDLSSSAGKKTGVDNSHLDDNSSVGVSQTIELLDENNLIFEESHPSLTRDTEDTQNKENQTLSHRIPRTEIELSSQSSHTDMSELNILEKTKKIQPHINKNNSIIIRNKSDSSDQTTTEKTSEVNYAPITDDEIPIKIKEKNCEGPASSLNNSDARTEVHSTSKTISPCKNFVEGCDTNKNVCENITDGLSKIVECNNKTESSNKKKDPVKDLNLNMLKNTRIEEQKKQDSKLTDKFTEQFINSNEHNNVNITLESTRAIEVGQSTLTKAPEINISPSNIKISEQSNILNPDEDRLQSSEKGDQNVAVNKLLEFPGSASMNRFNVSPPKTRVTSGNKLLYQSENTFENVKGAKETFKNKKINLEKQKNGENVSVGKIIEAKETIKLSDKSSQEQNMEILISLQLSKKELIDTPIMPKIKVRDFSKDMPAVNAVLPKNNASSSLSSKKHNNSCSFDNSDTVANDDTNMICSFNTRKEDHTTAAPSLSGPVKTYSVEIDNQDVNKNISEREKATESTERLIKPYKTQNSSTVTIVRQSSIENAASVDYLKEKKVKRDDKINDITLNVPENTPSQSSSCITEKKSSKSAHKDKAKEKSPRSTRQKILNNFDLQSKVNSQASLEFSESTGNIEIPKSNKSVDESTRKSYDSKQSQNLTVKNQIDDIMPNKISKYFTEYKSSLVHSTGTTSSKEAQKVEKKSDHKKNKCEDKKRKEDIHESKERKKKIGVTILDEGSRNSRHINPDLEHTGKLSSSLKSPPETKGNKESSLLKSNTALTRSTHSDNGTIYLKSALNIKNNIARKKQMEHSKISADGNKNTMQSSQDPVSLKIHSNTKKPQNIIKEDKFVGMQHLELSKLNQSYQLNSDKTDKSNSISSAIKSPSKSKSSDSIDCKNLINTANKSPQLKAKAKSSVKQSYDNHNENVVEGFPQYKTNHDVSSICAEKEKSDLKYIKKLNSSKISAKTSKHVDYVNKHGALYKKRKGEHENVEIMSMPKKQKHDQEGRNIVSSTCSNLTASNDNLLLSLKTNQPNTPKKLHKKSKTHINKDIKLIPSTEKEDSVPVQKVCSISHVATSHSNSDTPISSSKKTCVSPEKNITIDESDTIQVMRATPKNFKSISLPKKLKQEQDESKLLFMTSVDLTSTKNSSKELRSGKLFDNGDKINEEEVRKKESFTPKIHKSKQIEHFPPTGQENSAPVQKNSSLCNVKCHSNSKETSILNSKKTCEYPENDHATDESDTINIETKRTPENVKSTSLRKKRKQENESKICFSTSVDLTSEKNSSNELSPGKFDNSDEIIEEVRKKESVTPKKLQKSKIVQPIPPSRLDNSAPVQKNSSICNVTLHSCLKETLKSSNEKTNESYENNHDIDEASMINTNKSTSLQDILIQEVLGKQNTEEDNTVMNPQLEQGKHACSIALQISDKKQICDKVYDTGEIFKYTSKKERIQPNLKNTLEIVASPSNTSTRANLSNQLTSEENVEKKSTFSDQKIYSGAPLKRVIILPKAKTIDSSFNDHNDTLRGSESNNNKKSISTTHKKNLGYQPKNQLPKVQLKKAIVITKDMIIKSNIAGAASIMKERLSFKKMNSGSSSKMQVSNYLSQQNVQDHSMRTKPLNCSTITEDKTTNMITTLDLINILSGNESCVQDSVKERSEIGYSVPLKEDKNEGDAKELFGTKKVEQRIDTKDDEDELENTTMSSLPLSISNNSSNEKSSTDIFSMLPKKDLVPVNNNEAKGQPETMQKFGMTEDSSMNESEFIETQSNDSMEVANYVDIVTSPSPSVSSEIPINFESPENTYIGSMREYSCKFCSLKCNDEIVLLNHLTETHAYGNDENYETDLNNTLYKCGTCGAGFSLKELLDKHSKEHHGNENFKTLAHSKSTTSKNETCVTCGAFFVTEKEFDTHTCPPRTEPEFKVEVELLPITKKSVQFTGIKSEKKNPKKRKHIKTYKCDTCNMKFKSGLLLYNHNRKRHTEPIYKCDACNSKFRNKRDFLRHRCMPAPIACKRCKVTFATKELLLEHKKQKHNMGSLKCEYCSKYFKTNLNLMKHTTSKHFKSSEYKNPLHKYSKQGKKSNSHCNDIYNDLKIINQATLQFNLLPKIKKSVSKNAAETLKKFDKKNNIKKSAPEHICDICKLDFQSEKDLLLHSKIHKSLRRLYKCLKCRKKFPLKTTLLKHIKKDHNLEPNKIYRCQYCCSVFRFEDKLDQHYKFKHNDTDKDNTLENETKLCTSKMGAQKTNITRTKNFFTANEISNTKDKPKITSHLIISPKILNGEMFMCDECSAYLPSKESLRRHVQLEHQKEHSCGHCNQVFATTESFWQHLSNGHGNVKMKDLMPTAQSGSGPENSIKWKTQLVHNYKKQEDK